MNWIMEKIGEFVEKMMSAMFNWLLKSFAESLKWMIDTLGAWWLNIKSPDMGPGSASEAITNATVYFVAVAGIIGTAFGLVRVVKSHSRDDAVDLLMALFSTMATTTIGGVAVGYALKASDQVSPWLLKSLSGQDGDNKKLGDLIGLSARGTPDMVIGAVLILLIVAVVAAIAGLINLFFVLFTYAVIGVLVGLLPIFAAQSQTASGRQRFWKVIGWIFACVLYKPTAALIYGFGAMWVGGVVGDGQKNDPAGQLVSMMSGMILVLMSCIALPMLIRLVTPSPDRTASGISAGSGIAAAAGAVAVGAIGGASLAAGAGSASKAATGGGASAARTGSGAGAGNGAGSGAESSGATDSVGASGSGATDSGNGGVSSVAGPQSSLRSGESGSDSGPGQSGLGESGASRGSGRSAGAPGVGSEGGSSEPGSVSDQSNTSGAGSGSSGATGQAGGSTGNADQPVPQESARSSAGAGGNQPSGTESKQNVMSPNMRRALAGAGRFTGRAAGQHMADVRNELED